MKYLKETFLGNGNQFLFIIIFLLIFLSYPASFVSANNSQETVDVVFVLDVSNSMNETDRESLSKEVLKMFIDMSEANLTRIGLVAYNHNLVEIQPLTAMSKEAEKSQLKKKIAGLQFSGYTDLGLGLLTGEKILLNRTQKTSKSFIILLSDGGTDLPPNGGSRTVNDSNKDVEQAISKANAEGHPIYTIGLNHDGSVNKNQLEHIAQKTEGKSFITNNTNDLYEIFNQIFSDQIGSILLPIATVTATGELQEVTVKIPNSSMNEANFILFSNHPIQEAQLFYPLNDVKLSHSNKYSLFKIQHPKSGNVLLKFKGAPKDLIKINLLGNYKFQAKMELPSTKILKGKTVGFKTSIYQSLDNNPLKDQDVYRFTKANLIVKNISTNKVEHIPMKFVKDKFELSHIFQKSGKYEVQTIINGEYFNIISDTSLIDIKNSSPKAVSDTSKLTIKTDRKQSKIDLSNYFKDANHDKLIYTIISNDHTKYVNVVIEDHSLLISPLDSGKSSITISATDPEGKSANTKFVMTVNPLWANKTVYLIGIFTILVIGVFIYLMNKPKSQFAGRLEGYFLHTASGYHLPIKFWTLSSFKDREQITLYELFKSLDVDEELPESKNILIKPGRNGTLLFKHNTRCTILKENVVIQKNTKVPIHDNETIYINFEDGITEIELKFKELKSISLVS